MSWVGNEQSENLGPKALHIKGCSDLTLLFPFAAPRVAGDPSRRGRARDGDEGSPWAVERLTAGVVTGADRTSHRGCTLCYPARPTGECLAATAPTVSQRPPLMRVVARWAAEDSAQRVTLAHA